MIVSPTDAYAPSDPRQWRMLTVAQRLQLIEDLLIEHGLFCALTAEIDRCALYAHQIVVKMPPCLVILGETCAGKTTLVETWLRRSSLKRQETPEGSIIPYLYVSVPAGATIKETASVFLRTMGDPNPSRGTKANLVGRLHLLIRHCQVRIIFVDEFQHAVNKETQRVLHDVADFLKDIINQNKVSMVLIGRSGEAEPILRVNPQLESRVGSPLYMKPFEWDRNQAQTTILEFRALMDSIDRALPFDLSQLSTEEMAYRFFYATNGYLGWIMQLIRRAAFRAIQTECPTLNLPLLAAAYDASIAQTAMGRGKINPFSPLQFCEADVPLVQTRNEREQLPATSTGRGTNRRGRRKSQGSAPA